MNIKGFYDFNEFLHKKHDPKEIFTMRDFRREFGICIVFSFLFSGIWAFWTVILRIWSPFKKTQDGLNAGLETRGPRYFLKVFRRF